MKKCIRYINYLLLLLSLISAVCYAHFSGLPLKTLNATIFMLLGLINAGYAFKKRAFNPLCMVFALAFCMAADVTLSMDVQELNITENSRLIFDVKLSQRPPELKNAHLLYVLGSTEGLEAPHTQIIPLEICAGRIVMPISEAGKISVSD